MILSYQGKWPKIHETAFIAPTSDVIGEVEIGNHSTIWFQCVIRGDVNAIQIGNNTNIQDHSILHTSRNKGPLKIGNDVTVGHRVTLHGCTIGDRVLVGMGAIVLDQVEIGHECLIGAGSLITQGTQIPPRSLVLGSPAKVVRSLTDDEVASVVKSAENYVALGVEYYGNVQGPSRPGLNNSDLDMIPDGFVSGFEGDGI